MEKKLKFIIVALVGILAISIFINFQAYLLKKAAEKERNELKNENITLARTIKEINQENQRLQERVALLTKDLDKITKEKEEAQKTKDQLLEQLKSINVRLMKEGNEKQKIQEDLSSIKRKNTLLKQQLKSLIKRKALLEKSLALQHKAERASSPALKESETQVGVAKVLEAQPKKQLVVSATGAVELPPIVVYSQSKTYLRQPQESASLTPIATVAIEGKILGVNKENNFVVIDLGEDSGVKIGDTFQVYKADNVIASIEVIQTRKRISACDIKKEIKPIQVGDIVK